MKHFKFSINGNIYEVEINRFEDNTAELEVNGTNYQVEVHREIKEPKTPTLIRQKIKGPEQADIEKAEAGSIAPTVAPLPGNVLKVLVKPGDIVKKGDTLLIMESMKMENNVLALKDGVVEKVLVVEGQAVLQGDVMIELV